MAKDWNYIDKLLKMKAGYMAKLRQLKLEGILNRNGERIQETRESIFCLSKEVRETIKTFKDDKTRIN